jgi:flavin-binding protein dodecin
MPERTYKLEEIVGVSETSANDSIRNAIARAH